MARVPPGQAHIGREMQHQRPPLAAGAQSLLQSCLALGPPLKLGPEVEGGSELPAFPVHHTSEEGATREPGSVCSVEKAGGAFEVLCSWANFFSLSKG